MCWKGAKIPKDRNVYVDVKHLISEKFAFFCYQSALERGHYFMAEIDISNILYMYLFLFFYKLNQGGISQKKKTKKKHYS